MNRGGFLLYEGLSASQDLVCGVPFSDGLVLNLQSGYDAGCENDEAKSMKIWGVKKDTLITLYDDPGRSQNDDYLEVYMLQDCTRAAPCLVATFENTFSTQQVSTRFHRSNGLNGKVSSLKIESPAPSSRAALLRRAKVMLYSGNNQDNQMCILTADYKRAYNLQDYSPCSNDDARSMKLCNMKKGTYVTVYDSPSGSHDDDWTSMQVLSDFADCVYISTFETSKTWNSKVKSVFHKDTGWFANGLNGKVSRVYVWLP